MFHTIFVAFACTAVCFGSVRGVDHAKAFSYGVSIRGPKGHICGGAIIGKYHVLTSGHCMNKFAKPKTFHESIEVISVPGANSKFSDYFVVTGVTDYTAPGEIYRIDNIDVHPDFHYQAFAPVHDIAVITLSRPIIFNYSQRAINATKQDYILEEQIGTLSGWGFVRSGVRLSSRQMKVSELVLYERETCDYYYHDYIPDNSFCAVQYEDGEKNCIDNSGSPLVYDNELVGLLSREFICGANRASQFTSVFKYASFIENTVRRKSNEYFRYDVVDSE